MTLKRTGIHSLVMAFFIGCCSCKSAPKLATADNFSLLWEITGNGTHKPSYLYGTVHVYDSAVFRIPKTVYKTLRSCDDFVSEIDMASVNRLAMQQRMRITDPDSTLDKIMSPEVYTKLLEIPMVKMLGGEQVKYIKPFFLTPYLVNDGSGSLPSVDMELETYARKWQKNISGIETIDEQLDAVDALPLAMQAEMIEQSILEYDDPRESVKRLLILYKNQDFKGFEEEMNRSMASPLFGNELIEKRNNRMAYRINDSLQQKQNNYFIAVGAMHLDNVNEIKGLVTLLKDYGYALRPIKLEFE